MAGNIRTLCATSYVRGGEIGPRIGYAEAGPLVNARGGLWLRGAAWARSACRTVQPASGRRPMTGLRLFSASTY